MNESTFERRPIDDRHRVDISILARLAGGDVFVSYHEWPDVEEAIRRLFDDDLIDLHRYRDGAALLMRKRGRR